MNPAENNATTPQPSAAPTDAASRLHIPIASPRCPANYRHYVHDEIGIWVCDLCGVAWNFAGLDPVDVEGRAVRLVAGKWQRSEVVREGTTE